MTESRYAKNLWMIVGSSVALLVFTFILVAHHLGTPGRVERQRSVLLGGAASGAERIKPVGQANAGSPDPRREAAAAAVAAPPPGRDGQQVYKAGCFACHDAGVAGAPKLGDKGQWAARIAKGVDTLYASAVNGVQGSAGIMPAKGGNPALSDAEVKAAVDFMVAQSN